ncbi:MAG: hypothetical protein VKI81_08625 [Synechococcaceae cyanobacterium]|nr:hypothetical protein [Synechococcaceae cyanobacterium]
MADPSAAPDPLARYDTVEAAYRREDWPAVLTQARGLLRDLEGRSDALSSGLVHRLQLLLGHTQLHGLGNRQAAAAHYRAVREAGAEARLVAIAEEGLRECSAPEPAAAMPWLQGRGSQAPLVPEVVEEPELIEVHQADPGLAEDLDVPLRAVAPAPSAPPAAAATPEARAEDPELLRGLLRVVMP